MANKKYMIVSYAILVRSGSMLLEAQEGSDKEIVPESYKLDVAQYLAQQG
jgi:hypothetical protein